MKWNLTVNRSNAQENRSIIGLAQFLWGDIGSNAQHAFYQLLHQGTQRVSCDFITPIHRYNDTQIINNSLVYQHKLSLANCLAQSQVLAFGNAALPYGVANVADDLAKFKNIGAISLPQRCYWVI